MKTIEDLKKTLKNLGVSPEQFAKQANVSHMTIRRLIAKSASSPIPQRYLVQFEHVISKDLNYASALQPQLSGSGDFNELFDQLRKDGMSVKNTKKLHSDISAKLKLLPNYMTLMRTHITFLLGKVSGKTPLKLRAVAIGALLYFINPFDLIPDATPVVGYLDDFAILSLAAAYILKPQSKIAAPSFK